LTQAEVEAARTASEGAAAAGFMPLSQMLI